jgi:acyl-phosphate glycerol 3-phosphate acyltransferase
MRDAIAAAISFGVGSIVWGVVLGRLLLGRDLRSVDNPGASGSFRQFGALFGISIGLLDLGKGAFSVTLARILGASPLGVALSAVAATTGHNWPVWFGFRGGGGLATAVGGLGSIAPAETALAIAVSLLAALLFKLSPIYGKLPISSLPAGAMAGMPLLVWLTWRTGNTTGLLASTLSMVVIGIRGLQMLAERERRAGGQ